MLRGVSGEEEKGEDRKREGQVKRSWEKGGNRKRRCFHLSSSSPRSERYIDTKRKSSLKERGQECRYRGSEKKKREGKREVVQVSSAFLPSGEGQLPSWDQL